MKKKLNNFFCIISNLILIFGVSFGIIIPMFYSIFNKYGWNYYAESGAFGIPLFLFGLFLTSDFKWRNK